MNKCFDVLEYGMACVEDLLTDVSPASVTVSHPLLTDVSQAPVIVSNSLLTDAKYKIVAMPKWGVPKPHTYKSYIQRQGMSILLQKIVLPILCLLKVNSTLFTHFQN
jgi:hypothetical protein